MAQNSKKPGNLTNLPPDVLQELIRIEEQDKQNNPEKKQSDQMMQALLAATGAVNGLMELKTGIDQNHQQTFSALTDTHQRLSDAVDALVKNDQTGNFQQVVEGLDKLSREIQLKLVDVEKAAQSKPEIKPNIKVDSPKVSVTVDKPDLKPLQTLLKTELPKQVKALADAIPEVPETDLSTVEKSLKDMISVMQQVRDRKIPIPQFPTNMKVVNPDGTPIAGGSGGGGTQYTSGGTAVANPVGNSLIYFNGSNVPVAVTSSNPLPITGTISVGSTADESTFTAGTSTTGPIAGVFNDSVATLTSGQQGTIRATTNRGLHTNLRNASGTEIATSSNPVRIDPTGTTTQPVSATSLPLPTGASTSALQTTGNTSVASIDTKTPALGQALAASSVPVVLPSTQITTLTPPTSVTVTQGTGTNLHTVVDSGSITANAGTNLNTSALALDATLTGGSAKSVIRGGAKGTTTVADVTSTASGANHQPVDVAIYDAAGNQITSFGGGTQYAEGVTTSPATGTVALGRYQSSAPTLTTGQLYTPQLDANGNLKVNIASGGGSGGTSSSFATTFPTTGTAIGAKNGSNMVNLAADGSSNLLVNLATAIPTGSNAIGSITNTSFIATQATGTNLHTVVDSGSVTANAGTNLNTSALALETGGNLASIKTDVDNLNTAQGATTTGLKGPIIQGAVTTVTPTYTTATSNPLSLTTAGGLRIDGSGTTQPVSVAGTLAVNMTQINGVAGSVGNGTTDTGTQRVTLSSDSTGQVKLATGANTVGAISNTSFIATQATATNLNATVVGTGTFAVQTTSDTPGTSATNLGKAEDAASASGDTGVFTLGVRNDTVADSTNANGDYTQFSTDVKGHILTTNAPRLLKVQQQTTITSSTSETTVLTSIASTFLDVYGVIIANTSATACAVTFKDATAGTTRFIVEVPASDTRGFTLPIDAAYTQVAVANNWTATAGTSVASLQITMMAVKNI